MKRHIRGRTRHTKLIRAEGTDAHSPGVWKLYQYWRVCWKRRWYVWSIKSQFIKPRNKQELDHLYNYHFLTPSPSHAGFKLALLSKIQLLTPSLSHRFQASSPLQDPRDQIQQTENDDDARVSRKY